MKMIFYIHLIEDCDNFRRDDDREVKYRSVHVDLKCEPSVVLHGLHVYVFPLAVVDFYFEAASRLDDGNFLFLAVVVELDGADLARVDSEAGVEDEGIVELSSAQRVAQRRVVLIYNQSDRRLCEDIVGNNFRREKRVVMLLDEAGVHVALLELLVASQVDEEVDVRLQSRDLKKIRLKYYFAVISGADSRDIPTGVKSDC